MLAGFAKETITPKIGLPMAGYVGLRKSTGVLDELHVRCIYLKQEEEVFLFQYDLLYVDQVFVQKLISQVTRIWPIHSDHIIVSAMHTHSGPAQILEKSGIQRRFDYIDGGYDESLVSYLIEKGIQSAQKAYESQEESHLYFGKGAYRDIATNRNQVNDEFDDALTVLEIRQQQNRKAMIFSYACHPTIFHEENTQYSCDLLAAAYEQLEQEAEVAMFYNGACGDVSTRFTKQASTIEEAHRLGQLLVSHIKEVQQDMMMVPDTLQIMADTYVCDARSYPSQEKMRTYRQQCTSEKEKELCCLYEKMAFYLKDQRLRLALRVMKLGELYYIYVPVELFSKLSLMLKSKLKEEEVILVSYAMDYLSYMPDEAAYHKQPIEFEAVISPFAKGCGEAMMQTIAEIIKEMKKSLS